MYGTMDEDDDELAALDDVLDSLDILLDELLKMLDDEELLELLDCPDDELLLLDSLELLD